MIEESPRSITVPCLRVRQPIGEFFIGVMKWRELCDIADFDIRRIIRDRDVERYLGIERPLRKDRVEELGQYVNTVDATFPTSVIVAVEDRCALFDERKSELTLSNYPDAKDGEEPILYKQIARVLDGQHRIAGLQGFQGEEFDINVTIFVAVDISVQASIFSIVNLAQTKVSRSLVYDLYDLATTRSPQKSCHNIAVALDQNPNSPFHQRIKRLGVATEGRFDERITQAAFVSCLLPYISDNAMIDRDVLLRGKKLKLATDAELQTKIFRNMFIEERDVDIAEVIWNLFEAVRKRWPQAWDASGTGIMLGRTNGFRAFMRFLGPAYLHYTQPGSIVKMEQFLELLEKIKLKHDDFNTENFKPGTSGETLLFHTLTNQAGLD